MTPNENSTETSWTLIRDAARGSDAARLRFHQRYLPVARAYLFARWRGTPLVNEVDDAVQEVFLDCFRQGGILERAEPGRSGFKAFFGGVIRTIALRVETRRAQDHARGWGNPLQSGLGVADESGLAATFDREWARTILREASGLLAVRARSEGAAAERRVELLRLRFQDGLPIREIASNWGEDPARVHHEYAKARLEFLGALREVLGLDEFCTREQLEEECGKLLSVLG